MVIKGMPRSGNTDIRDSCHSVRHACSATDEAAHKPARIQGSYSGMRDSFYLRLSQSAVGMKNHLGNEL